MAKEAFAGWRELERGVGQELLELNGLLELVESSAQSSADALEAAGASYELLDARRRASRWPVGVPDGWTALFQPEAGIVRADLAHRAFVDRAVAHGARLEEETRIESLDELDAKVIVVTAGPWVRSFFPDLPVRTTRETVAYFRRDGRPAALGRAARSGHARPRDLLAARPGARPEGRRASRGRRCRSRRAGRARSRRWSSAIAEWVARTYPDADPNPVAAETCMYTTTPDEHFILERRGKVVIGSPCSGHGFKFAPAIGNRLAALAADIL